MMNIFNNRFWLKDEMDTPDLPFSTDPPLSTPSSHQHLHGHSLIRSSFNSQFLDKHLGYKLQINYMFASAVTKFDSE
jgi:hypothetical protein